MVEFNPDFILISSGFDAHRLDPLSTIDIIAEGFGDLTDILLSISEQICGGNVISILEGGYDLKALLESTEMHINALLEDKN